ncbi:YciI family protein [Spirosoma jeollabukense]
MMEDYRTHWHEWLDKLAIQNLLVRSVQHLDPRGMVIGPDNTEFDGPFSETGEAIGSLLILKAPDYETAVNLAKDCPILELGGNVEVRQGN